MSASTSNTFVGVHEIEICRWMLVTVSPDRRPRFAALVSVSGSPPERLTRSGGGRSDPALQRSAGGGHAAPGLHLEHRGLGDRSGQQAPEHTDIAATHRAEIGEDQGSERRLPVGHRPSRRRSTAAAAEVAQQRLHPTLRQAAVEVGVDACGEPRRTERESVGGLCWDLGADIANRTGSAPIGEADADRRRTRSTQCSAAAETSTRSGRTPTPAPDTPRNLATPRLATGAARRSIDRPWLRSSTTSAGRPELQRTRLAGSRRQGERSMPSAGRSREQEPTLVDR